MAKQQTVHSGGNERWIGRRVRVDRAQDMRRYDRLPREVRDAMKALSSDVACLGLAGFIKKGVAPRALAELLTQHSHFSHVELMRADFGRVPEDGGE